MTDAVLNNPVTRDVVTLQAAAEAGRANAAGRPREPQRLAHLPLRADFHFPGLPMVVQSLLSRAFASLASL